MGAVDISIHDVYGVVGWCLGAYSEVENTYRYVHHLHTFLHTGSGLYNPLKYSSHTLSHGLISSTTLYNTLQSTVYSSSTVYNLYTTPLMYPLVPPLRSVDGGQTGAPPRMKAHLQARLPERH